MKIAVINPNTSDGITETIVTAARTVAGPGVEIVGVHPRRGVASVESHIEEAWATIGILEQIELAAAAEVKADAYVIACFGDTGIDAAREAATVPVVGMTEAALFTAATLAHRFAIVTMPPRTIAQSDRVVRSLGLGHRCTVRAVDVPVSELEHGSVQLLELFAAEARVAIETDGAEAIVLGCAGLADLVEPLSSALGVPVVEGVAAAVAFASGLVAQGLMTSRVGAYGTVLGAPSAAGVLR
jgi:allantoin racemase